MLECLVIDAAHKLRRGHTVSRPPSSHITRVDEESSASDSGGRSAASRFLRPRSVGVASRLVETVDRGVGPTPLPTQPSLADFHHFPSFLLSPYVDPRNGVLDTSFGIFNLLIYIVYIYYNRLIVGLDLLFV